jgi:LysM repeat protein
MSVPGQKMKGSGAIILLLLFISACSDVEFETDRPTNSPVITPTDVPIIDLKITIKPKATIEEINSLAFSTPTSTLEPTPTYLSYVIVSGDTLVDIAARLGVSVTDIEAVNPGIKAELLSVGQEINLPPLEVKTPEVPPVDEFDLGSGLEVLGLANYVAPADNLWVLGAVKNTSSVPLRNVRVDITISSRDGQILASQDILTQPDIIFPGELSAIAAPFENHLIEEFIVEASISNQRLDIDPRFLSMDLNLEGSSVSSVGLLINYQGSVVNSGSDSVGDIIVLAIFLDEMNKVIGFRMTEIGKLLAPGERTTFSDRGIGFNGPPFRTEFAVHGTIVDD